MKFVLYTNSVSAHQLPLAREIVAAVGMDNFRYIYTGNMLQGGGQEVASSESWIIQDEKLHSPTPTQNPNSNQWLETCDVLLSGNRDVELFERRCASGRKTYYMSERWFKPPMGILRLLHPRYFRMANRLVKLLGSLGFTYLPIGIHAARDMARLYCLLHGDLRCLFRAPEVLFDRKPMGAIVNYPWMKMWGYFVAPSTEKLTTNKQPLTIGRALRVLWVGRMLKLKHVDTIIRAVSQANKDLQNFRCTTTTPDNNPITLTLVGSGPEEARLKKLASSLELTTNNQPLTIFLPPVSIVQVRDLMRQHDVYVFSSDGHDGWGAVVSEALEEKMCVLGSYESGASATILPRSQLFHFYDFHALSKLLMDRNFCLNGIERWSASNAARSFLQMEVS